MSEARPHSVQEIRGLSRADNPVFCGVFVLRKVNQRTAKNDNPFLVVELGDKSGAFGTTVFGDSPAFAAFKSAREGDVIRIEAKLDYFQDRLAPKILRAELVAPGELAANPALLDTLVESTSEDPARLEADFVAGIAALQNPELRATVQSVFDELGDTFRTSPAAVSMHHAYRGGLLEHTVRMARAARALLPLYPEVDADLALAGVLLHDIGKTIEYESGLGIRKSRRGLLQGHVVLGYQLARKHGLRHKLPADLLERLEHVILSHQGELEWGAAVMAATPEAVFVSMIDNLDAKMGMVQRALRQAGPADEFSDYLPGLKAALLVRPPAPPPPPA